VVKLRKARITKPNKAIQDIRAHALESQETLEVQMLKKEVVIVALKIVEAPLLKDADKHTIQFNKKGPLQDLFSFSNNSSGNDSPI